MVLISLGDIERLSKLFPPHISVVTTVGDIPVHIEFFKSAEAVADEKSHLVQVLTTQDFAVLNHDDPRVFNMKSKTKARVVTFGFHASATVRASDVEFASSEEGEPLGTSFKLNEGSRFVPVRINGSLGKSQAWSAAAAAAVATILGMNLVDVSEALRTYSGAKGRLFILRGIKNSSIIDDSYNASPASTRLALETLRDVPGVRKISVLGDMLELGEKTEEAHKEIGSLAGEISDILVCVGLRAKFMAITASVWLPKEHIHTFDTSEEAKLFVQELIKEHDIVLVKGSQGMRMEKIVKEIMAEPDRAKELLVRQSARWLLKE
jgi:UDP-N-acetylmuramoyl-tripeptide--D-alanyl-D-alanine ligase